MIHILFENWGLVHLKQILALYQHIVIMDVFRNIMFAYLSQGDTIIYENTHRFLDGISRHFIRYNRILAQSQQIVCLWIFLSKCRDPLAHLIHVWCSDQGAWCIQSRNWPCANTYCTKIGMSATYPSHTNSRLIDCGRIIHVSNHLKAWKNTDSSKALL